jgi:BspA type Leucine rich repeat region (6 copies)
MNIRRCIRHFCLAAVLIRVLPVTTQAQFTVSTNNDGTINISGYTGPGGAVAIPDTISNLPVTSIGDSAFYNSTLTSLTLGTNVASIGEFAFASCLLISLSIPNHVTSIGDYAFSSCYSLLDVTIPASVTSLGEGPFAGCFRLATITVDATNPTYCSVAGTVFNKSQSTIIQCPGVVSTYLIPDSVTSIGGGAFGGCQLTSITIPAGVTSIGEDAFQNCFNLTNILLPASVTSLAYALFAGCENLTGITIPVSITSIGNSAFQFTGLTSITIPASVTDIGGGIFSYCYDLTGIYFQGNAPTPGYDVFTGDTATVYYLAGTTGWGAMYGGLPTALWNPQGQTIGITGAGVQNNGFTFTVHGTNTQIIVVEACTNLKNQNWQRIQTNTISGTSFNFSDLRWTNHPHRFYRAISPP